MTCNNYGEHGHNARGCAKYSKGKQPMSGNSRGKHKKQRTLVDEPNSEQPTSPVAADIPTEDGFHLSASQPSQNSQSNNFVFMPTPTVQRQLPTSNDLDFEIPNFEPEPHIALRPKSISEVRTRLQLRQKNVPIATRQIEFVGDSRGASQPSKLTFSAKGLTWLEKSAITKNQLNKQRLNKLKARKGSGKEQK
uniref:Uncharacterized protein n=1 Tax=Nicotiana tabacum TaxID=4097 RepID=A0A1S3ZU13_TOBAC|nr:PREDICTED: uncharacterized protein LOC107790484 [Nicotiana tabacum]